MKIILNTLLFASLGFAALSDLVQAQDNTQDAKAFVESLKFEDGRVIVQAAQAHLDLNPEYRYLPKADARRVLEEFWGNPPDESVLGLIVPRSPKLYENNSWAVVVSYADEGYVSDADAKDIDYADMLKTMKADTKDSNAARKEAGYGTVDLLGWAEPPRYDAGAKKIYWAKEIKFSGAPENTLNYEVRVLGRRGYLSLEAVANMSSLQSVREGMQSVLASAEFDDGARYADYNASTDKLAAYGLGALIAGGVAAKTGLFAKLLAVLIAGKKLIVFAVVGLGALIAKMFKGKKTESE